MLKQPLSLIHAAKHRLNHAVMQQRFDQVTLIVIQLAAIRHAHVVGNTTFNTMYRVQTAIVGDISRLRSPRRNRARPWHHQQQRPFGQFTLHFWTILQQALQQRLLHTKPLLQINKMDKLSIKMIHPRHQSLEGIAQLLQTKSR